MGPVIPLYKSVGKPWVVKRFRGNVLRSGRRRSGYGLRVLGLSVVVEDAARGIEAGVRAVYPEAAQRDDRFHALYEMNKVRRRLEQRAYGAITEELEAEALRDPVVAEDLADRPDVEGAVP